MWFILSDNMSVVLSFSRSRAKNYALLHQVRIFCALCLAFDIKPYVRWIASEVNAADEPSRVESDDKSKNLIAELSRIVDVAQPTVQRSVHVRGRGNAEQPQQLYDIYESTSGAAAGQGFGRPPPLDGEFVELQESGPLAQRFDIGTPADSERQSPASSGGASDWHSAASSAGGAPERGSGHGPVRRPPHRLRRGRNDRHRARALWGRVC